MFPVQKQTRTTETKHQTAKAIRKQRLIIVKKKLQRKSHKFKADPKKVEVNNPQVNFDKTEVIPNSSEVKDRIIPKPEITIKVNRPKPKVNYDLIEVITVSSEEDKETIIKIGENRGISFLVFGLYQKCGIAH